jgi:hypothetical protein
LTGGASVKRPIVEAELMISEISSGKQIFLRKFPRRQAIQSVAFAPDGKSIAAYVNWENGDGNPKEVPEIQIWKFDAPP